MNLSEFIDEDNASYATFELFDVNETEQQQLNGSTDAVYVPTVLQFYDVVHIRDSYCRPDILAVFD